MGLMIVFLSWRKRCINSAVFTVTWSFITNWCRMGQLPFGEDVLTAQYTSLIQWFVSGNFLQTDRVQSSRVLYRTFNAGTNWLCYFSQMWTLLCISPYIRRSWDLGTCVIKTCLVISASGIEKNIRMYKEICFFAVGSDSQYTKTAQEIVNICYQTLAEVCGQLYWNIYSLHFLFCNLSKVFCS